MTAIGFVGGTGPEGKGLAYRFALAGHEVLIGSRSDERARDAANEIAGHAGRDGVGGAENTRVAADAQLVVVTVPFSAQADTLPPLREALETKVVVSTAVPLSFEGGRPTMLAVPEGSASEQVQALLPEARVVGAFHNLGAGKLWQDAEPLHQDVIVCAEDDEAKREVVVLAEQIAGVRAVDGGLLEASRYVEGITVLLIGINRIHKATTGIRVVGLP